MQGVLYEVTTSFDYESEYVLEPYEIEELVERFIEENGGTNVGVRVKYAN